MNDSRPWVRPVMISGYEATVQFDPVTGIYRGEFVGLSEQVRFYAAYEEQMLTEGRRALFTFLERCKSYSRVPKGDA